MLLASRGGWRDLSYAVAASLAVILGAPYLGQVRGWVQDALPGHYRWIVAAIVVLGAGAAVVAAVAHIRDRKLGRYLLLAAALGIAVAYARGARTGNLDQDLVEQFHFVEYGAVTYLFHRVWRHRDYSAALVLPLCAGLVVGILDEWFQWFVPSRVGELHDVLINAVAVICGLLFSLGVHPPMRDAAFTGGRRPIATGVTVVVLTAAGFLDSVHLGYEVQDPRVGAFRSRFDAATLTSAAAERAARWPGQPPLTSPGIAREDHYLAEGQWHVQRRNETAGGTDRWRAWHENTILETFFAPVLDLGFRWAPEQRTAEEANALPDRASYRSDAEPFPILVIDRSILWAPVALIVAGLSVLGFAKTRPRSRGFAS